MTDPTVINKKVDLVRYPDDLKHLISMTTKMENMTFTITNIDHAIANAIRRVAIEEVQTIAMYYDYEDVECSDKFILADDYLQNRIRAIPLLQNTKSDATFTLKVENNGITSKEIYTGDIKGSGRLPFDDNIPLITLSAGHKLHIKKIYIVKDYGFNNGQFSSLVHQIVALPEANGTTFNFQMGTTGVMPAEQIIKKVCLTIIDRLRRIRDRIKEIYVIEQNNYGLIMHGESPTTAVLIIKAVNSLYKVNSMTYDDGRSSRLMHLRIRCDEDVNMIMRTAVDSIISKFNVIVSYLK